MQEVINAIQRNDANTLRQWLQTGIDVNQRDPRGNTLLHLACAQSADLAREILLDPSVQVNATNPDGNTPLHEFCTSCKQEADCNTIIDLFMQRGAVLDSRNELGETPLHKAVLNTSTGLHLVKALLASGRINVNVENNNGETCLHYAVRLDRPVIFSLLVQAGANVNVRAQDGTTLAELAQAYNATTIAQMLSGENQAQTSAAPPPAGNAAQNMAPNEWAQGAFNTIRPGDGGGGAGNNGGGVGGGGGANGSVVCDECHEFPPVRQAWTANGYLLRLCTRCLERLQAPAGSASAPPPQVVANNPNSTLFMGSSPNHTTFATNRAVGPGTTMGAVSTSRPSQRPASGFYSPQLTQQAQVALNASGNAAPNVSLYNSGNAPHASANYTHAAHPSSPSPTPMMSSSSPAVSQVQRTQRSGSGIVQRRRDLGGNQPAVPPHRANGCALLSLPHRLVVHVLGFLSDRELCNFGQTCHGARVVAADNYLWYELAETNCCARCCRCFRWSHTLNLDTYIVGRVPRPEVGFYKAYYREKYLRCVSMSENPAEMRRYMSRRCIYCAGRRREFPHPPIPGVGLPPVVPGPPDRPDYVQIIERYENSVNKPGEIVALPNVGGDARLSDCVNLAELTAMLQRYEGELQQLAQMGYKDRDVALKALKLSSGDMGNTIALLAGGQLN